MTKPSLNILKSKNESPVKSKPQKINFEDVLNKIGPFNRYQAYSCATYLSGYLCLGANILFMSFGNLEPSWRCPTDFGSEFSKNCSVYKRCFDSLEFKSDSGFYSVVEEFQLVCDMAYASNLIISIQMGGVLFGTILGGILADRIGRKSTFLLVLVSQISFGSISSILPNWESFAVIRFLIGISTGAQAVVSFTFTLETIGEKDRLKVRPMGTGPVSQIWFSALAYLITNWRILSVVVNIQSLIAIPLLIFKIYESPRWLMTHGKTEKCKQVLDDIASVNRRSKLTEKEFLELVEFSNKQRTYGTISDKETNFKPKSYYFWHIFSTRKLASYSSVLGVVWFTAGAIAFGLNFNLSNLFGSPQLILAAFGLFGWIAMLFAMFLDHRFKIVGRKIILLYSLMGQLICFAVIVIYQSWTHQTHGALLGTGMTILVVLGHAINEGAWLAVYQLTAELYPTVVRGMAGGLGSAAGRVGAIAGPYILFLGNVSTPLPYLILGSLTAISLVISAVFLDETKGNSMPETIEEMDSGLKESEEEAAISPS